MQNKSASKSALYITPLGKASVRAMSIQDRTYVRVPPSWPFRRALVFLALGLALAGCSGGGGGTAAPSIGSVSTPQTHFVAIGVVQANLTSPAIGVPVYVNGNGCSGCSWTLTTDSVGATSVSVPSGTYCFSLHNPNVDLVSAPAIPIYSVGASGPPYLVSDACMAISATTTIYMAE